MVRYIIFSLVLVIAYMLLSFFGNKYEKLFSKPWHRVEKWLWPVSLVFSVTISTLFWVYNYLFMPTFAFDCPAIYIETILFLLIVVFSYVFVDSCGYFEDPWKYNKVYRWTTIGVFIGTGLFLLSGLYTWDFFHDSFKQSMLKVEQVDEDKNGLSPISVDKMCTVSPQVAQRVILTKMGDLKNTYDIGEMTKQSFTGKFEARTSDGQKVNICYENHLIYVAVLEHKSFFTWSKQGYSPAYVIVDATDEHNAYVITEVNGEPLNIKYTEGAFWSYNLERHLRMNGYASIILDDFNIEIDENGRPFAPVTTLKNTIGFSTKDVTGVAVVDVQTGEINHYTPENAPAFVNRIYPEGVIYKRIYWWGDYKNGYFHWSNKTGLLQACKGMDIVQTDNGCFYYVGVQAQSDVVGTQGYMLVDIRTGKARYFRRSGISEQEAIRVLKANTELNLEINQYVLTLTEPIFYNIEGLKTYFATYVSTSDYTVKYYGFCSTDDKSVWGYGKTLEEAKASYLSSYYNEMTNKDIKFQTEDKHSIINVEAEILEKVQEGNAYYFRLKGYEGKTFFGYSSIIPDLRWKASKIKISYNQTDNDMIVISSYEKVE